MISRYHGNAFILSGSRRGRGCTSAGQAAFTLIELLVVVTIIIVLLALLTPALDKALMQAELTVCGARQHGLFNVFSAYAIEHQRRWPSGKRDDGYEHAIFVSTNFVDMVTAYGGNSGYNAGRESEAFAWGGIPPMMVDASYKDFGWYQPGVGWGVGYMYIGGHPALDAINGPNETRPGWTSPKSLANSGSGELLVCHATWSLNAIEGFNVDSWTVVAHGAGGSAYGEWSEAAGYYMNYNQFKRADDPSIGLVGGNQLRVDGSVQWRDVLDMNEYLTGQGGGYPALW